MIKVKGKGRAILKYDDGHVEIYEQNNMIVNVGFEFIMKAMTATSGRPAVMQYVAVGKGGGATTSAMTKLVNESNRHVGTWQISGKTFVITAPFGRGVVTGNITEGGVFNASSGGTMLDRLLFTTPITVDSSVDFTQEFEFELI